MKKAALVVSLPYQNDRIFEKDSALNRDDCLVFFRELQTSFKQRGYELRTQDQNSVHESEIVIFNDMPAKLPAEEEVQKSGLLIYESELIRPDNWDLEKHKRFSRIFTWNDTFIDNSKYFKFNFTHGGGADFLSFREKTGFLTLIAGQHKNRHPLELYSQRQKAIEFYEKNHPGFFDFYGMHWDQYTFRGPKLWRGLNKVPGLRKALGKKWKNYRGPVKSKHETFQKYKFSICFENAKEIPGYITEKIFDSLVSGCIPVYWGAPNIADFVWPDCYVDFRQFMSFEKLHGFLESMSESDYNDKIKRIQEYLKSDLYKGFLPKPNADKVASAMTQN